jgi:hypothetical protein
MARFSITPFWLMQCSAAVVRWHHAEVCSNSLQLLRKSSREREREERERERRERKREIKKERDREREREREREEREREIERESERPSKREGMRVRGKEISR